MGNTISPNNTSSTESLENMRNSNEELISKCEKKKANYNIMEEYWEEQERLLRESLDKFKKKNNIRFLWQLTGEKLTELKEIITNIYKARGKKISFGNKFLSENNFILSLIFENGKLSNSINLGKHLKAAIGL